MNYQDFPKYVFECCQGCIFKQLFQLCTELSSLLFIAFLLCYSFKIIPAKPLGCFSFLFTQVWVMPTFQTEMYPWMPMRPSTLFFCCKMPEKSTRIAGLKVCGWSYAQFSIGKETRLQGRAYLCMSVIYVGFVQPLLFVHSLLSSFK